jgi:hypothetical protein
VWASRIKHSRDNAIGMCQLVCWLHVAVGIRMMLILRLLIGLRSRETGDLHDDGWLLAGGLVGCARWLMIDLHWRTGSISETHWLFLRLCDYLASLVHSFIMQQSRRRTFDGKTTPTNATLQQRRHQCVPLRTRDLVLLKHLLRGTALATCPHLEPQPTHGTVEVYGATKRK